jgi:hypothetical protein
MGIEAGAWEQEAKDLHPIHNIFMLRCDPTGSCGLLIILSVPGQKRKGQTDMSSQRLSLAMIPPPLSRIFVNEPAKERARPEGQNAWRTTAARKNAGIQRFLIKEKT